MRSILTFSSLLLFSVSYGQTNPPPADVTVSDSATNLVQAKFPGGAPGWQQYLEKNLHPEVAAENIVLKRRQKDSAQTVIVIFLVDTQGTIREVKVDNIKYVTPAVGAEAVRVIQKGPKWIPAVQDGHPVIFRQKQLITFVVSKG